MTLHIQNTMRILFQGDSITDCSRNWFGTNVMGNGYASMAAAHLQTRYKEKNITCINRGVSGDCVSDLLRRWQKDCLSLKPDMVSILVGVNDLWQAYEGITGQENEVFYNNYHEILQRARDTLHPQFIICEPFLLPVSDDIIAMRQDLAVKIDLIKQLAAEFDAAYVPFDTMFTDALKNTSPSYWAGDGVHPTQAGHALMAKEWVFRVIGKE